MKREEFIKYIESIGFEDIGIGLYGYKEFRIHIWGFDYTFYDGSVFDDNIPLNDLELIEKKFKKEFRSIKLKALLGEPRLISKI